MVFDFGSEVCGDLSVATKREWLVTNGIGGYASGTIANVQTRRYHGLLMAALKPPLGRTLLLAKLDETAEYDGIYPESGRFYPLYANRWADGLVEPLGHHYLNRFHLEGTTPVWTFACANALLEKRIWMQPGANTTYHPVPPVPRHGADEPVHPRPGQLPRLPCHDDHGRSGPRRGGDRPWPAHPNGRRRHAVLSAERQSGDYAATGLV